MAITVLKKEGGDPTKCNHVHSFNVLFKAFFYIRLYQKTAFRIDFRPLEVPEIDTDGDDDDDVDDNDDYNVFSSSQRISTTIGTKFS